MGLCAQAEESGTGGSQELNGQSQHSQKGKLPVQQETQSQDKRQRAIEGNTCYPPWASAAHKGTLMLTVYTTYKYKEKLLINMRSKLQEKLKPSVPLNRKLCQEELREATGDVTANHCEKRS